MMFDVKTTDAAGDSCITTCAIDVATGICVDWSNLLWDDAAVSGTIPPDTFTPSNATGDTFTFSTAVAQSSNAANITYNGPACNCNLHITIATSGDLTQIIGMVFMTKMAPPFNQLFYVDFRIGNPNYYAAGTYDIPFTLPDSGGTPYSLNLSCVAFLVSPTMTIDVTGKFSTV